MAHPTPSTWTLRLKSHRTTILLHIDPLTPFAKIKSTLYTALLETGLQATSNGPTIALPSSPEEIKLGRPIDALDASQGFEMGEWEDDSAVSFSDGDGEGVGGDEGKVKGKGKGKAKGGGRKVGGGDVKDCPKGAGLKDGAVLAFRWEGDGVPLEEKGWGVQMASFEDAYGVVNEGDGGARGEFEG